MTTRHRIIIKLLSITKDMVKGTKELANTGC